MDSQTIRVVVRIRPQNKAESGGNHKVAVQPLDERVLVFDPKEEESDHFFHGKRIRKRDITKRQSRDLKFAFDQVFAPHHSNKDVFEDTTKSVLDGILNGYNSSVFAYGATGAGKTHTMLGKPEDPGVTFLTVMELYERINALKNEKTIEVAVSYLEVYNEQIRDLLLPKGTLPIREDQHGIVVQGLSLHKPRDAEELMHMLAFGNQNRSQHPTDANSESSRSHAVFQVFVRQKDRTAGLTANVKIAKLALIDLAGSERATVTQNKGMRMLEGANINRSLLALGNVINALADNKVKAHHIPYRNSKLTRLLKDSLGGNCKTVMIAAVSPSSLSYEDTYNTLKYADRAKHIKAELKENVLNVDLHVSRYAQVVEELRKEITELKAKLQLGPCVPSSVSCSSTKSFQDKLCKIFSTRVNIRKELLEFESSSREIQWKIVCKDRKLTRLSLINSVDCNTSSVVEKIQRNVASSKRRLAVLNSRREAVMTRMSQNTESLKVLENEMKSSETGEMPELLQHRLEKHHLKVEVSEQRRCNKYLRSMIKRQENDAHFNDRLITALLQMTRKQYYVLKGHGFLTSDMTEDFIGLQALIDGVQEVRWADQNTAPQTTSQLLNFPVLSTSHLPATPSPKTENNLTVIYSPSPDAPCSGRSLGVCLTSTDDPTSVRPVHPALARVQGLDCDISPPLTQYAGRTPSAKHFVSVHSKAGEGDACTGKTENIPPCRPNTLPQSPGSQCHDLNVTYICSPVTPVVLDDPQQINSLPLSDKGKATMLFSPARAKRTKVTPSTVTKVVGNPDVAAKESVGSGSVTRVGVNNRTVTKVKSGECKENVDCQNVVRAIRFDKTPPTPNSEMTFAEAVKSPARPPLRSITDNSMSPLAQPLDSVMTETNKRSTVSYGSYGLKNRTLSSNTLRTMKMKTQATLERFRIPSLGHAEPKHQARRVTPHYMQMTKATANRSRKYSVAEEKGLTAERVKIDTPSHR